PSLAPVHGAPPANPRSSEVHSRLERAIMTSVFVCQTSTDHIAAKLVERRIRIQGRVLIIECQQQISPNFIIERGARHPTSIGPADVEIIGPCEADTGAERPLLR